VLEVQSRQARQKLHARHTFGNGFIPICVPAISFIPICVPIIGFQDVPMPLMEQALQMASNGLRCVFVRLLLTELRRVKVGGVLPLLKSFAEVLSARRRLLVYHNLRSNNRLFRTFQCQQWNSCVTKLARLSP
jgi:hypothetical protein